MNPAYLIKMVEVIQGPRTSDATMAAVTALLTALGRQSLVVRDSPGFVINRLLHPLINVAARVVDEGVASPKWSTACLRAAWGIPPARCARAT